MSAKTTITSLVVAAGLAAHPAAAIEPNVTPDERVESRLDADLNGDGNADLAYIVAADDWRELRVVLAGRNGTEALDLSTDALGPASLAMVGDVLRFEDLTGGTTAYSSTRRFRYDSVRNRMRLIGMDVTLYSRTFAHDGYEGSWNLLTGEGKGNELRLDESAGGDRAYDKARQHSFTRRTRPVWLVDAPDPEDLLEELREG